MEAHVAQPDCPKELIKHAMSEIVPVQHASLLIGEHPFRYRPRLGQGFRLHCHEMIFQYLRQLLRHIDPARFTALGSCHLSVGPILNETAHSYDPGADCYQHQHDKTDQDFEAEWPNDR